MNEFRADLHCHTTCSDGSATPEEVIRLAKKIGLSGLSITDHDTIEAYKQAPQIAKEIGIDLIPGLEISAAHKGSSVHILAYAFPFQSEIIRNFCEQYNYSRIERNKEIIRLLNKHGLPLTEEEIVANSHSPQHHRIIGRPHIALAMIKKGYVSTIKEAFQRYLSEGKPCYAPRKAFAVEDAIDLVHLAKGLCFIAHPHLISKTLVLKELLDMPFDGLEGYYAHFPLDANRRFLKMAERRHWIITGGSDYHGEIKPNNPLGSSFVNQDTFNILKEHFLKH